MFDLVSVHWPVKKCNLLNFLNKYSQFVHQKSAWIILDNNSGFWILRNKWNVHLVVITESLTFFPENGMDSNQLALWFHSLEYVDHHYAKEFCYLCILYVSPFPEFVLQRVISCIYQPNTRNRTHHESVLCQLCSRAE